VKIRKSPSGRELIFFQDFSIYDLRLTRERASHADWVIERFNRQS
jgi:hypothetical protein